MNRIGRVTVTTLVSLACACTVVFTATASTALPRGGKVIGKVGIQKGYGGLAIGEGAVWAVTDPASTLARIDPRSNAVAARITFEPENACPSYVCGEPAAGNGAVWIARTPDNTVLRVDPSSNSVTTTIPVGAQPVATAVSPGDVWVMNAGGPSVSRIDSVTNKVVATIVVGPRRAASDRGSVTAGGGAIWVSVPNAYSIVRIDPATNKVAATIRVSEQPCGFLAANERAVWASGAHCSSAITRIDPRANRQTGTVKGELLAPIGVALGFGSLWVADIDRKTIDRVNPRTGRIVARLPVGGFPVRLGVGFGSVWVRDDTGRVLRIRPQR